MADLPPLPTRSELELQEHKANQEELDEVPIDKPDDEIDQDENLVDINFDCQ